MWIPEKEFEDQDVYIIGGGPSLKDFNWKKLEDKNTIGCNSAFRKGSRVCNICFFSDPKWFEEFYKELLKIDGKVVTPHPRMKNNSEDWLYVMERGIKKGLYDDRLCYGGNSGCGAINLAFLMGAKRVFLLGFDCKADENNKPNWHNWQIETTKPDIYPKFLKGFEALAKALPEVFPECEIINLTPNSAIPFFPFNTFRKVAA